MIQEKYNNRIWADATEESIRQYSHLRGNVLEAVEIDKEDSILLLGDDSTALVEYLQGKCDEVVVDDAKEINSKFNIAINIGQIKSSPAKLKKVLSDGGKLVLAFSAEQQSHALVRDLLSEAGFTDIVTYRLMPDYLYTTEIFAEDYAGGEAGDYLLIAR